MSWIDSPWMVVGGLLAGFVFGFLLQKGQVAKYRVIVGQFLLADWTVLKVMLTAIVVGAIGVYAMLDLGLIAHLHVKGATLAANALGGVIFGVGMVGLGYCPGTGVAAVFSGSRHGLWGLAGMVVGAGIFTASFPALSSGFLKIGDMGKVTLADVSGVSHWVFIVVLAAIAGTVFTALRRANA